MNASFVLECQACLVLVVGDVWWLLSILEKCINDTCGSGVPKKLVRVGSV